jgi:Gas vesicle protein
MRSLEPSTSGGGGALTPAGAAGPPASAEGASNLADVLERVLDKGVVIAGDIQINLLDIELLTIKLRLIVAGVDTARRMGIDWWETDPWLAGRDAEDDRRSLSQRVKHLERQLETSSGATDERSLEEENDALRERLDRLQRQLEAESGSASGDD